MEKTDAVADPGQLGWPEFLSGMKYLDLLGYEGSNTQFRGEIQTRKFGDLQIQLVRGQGIRSYWKRSALPARQNRDELIWICLVLTGDIGINQEGISGKISSGDIALVDSTRPYDIEVSATRTDTLWIGTPSKLVQTHIWDLDEIFARRIDGSTGAGNIASRVLRQAFDETRIMPAQLAHRISSGLMDILAAAAETCRNNDNQSHYHKTIVRRIKSYIDAHLHEETLSISRIASEQGLSQRYLSKLFKTEEQTLSAWIWNRRLERCHAALINGACRQNISDIAYAHGFKNQSHFSRMFRKRYGLNPKALLQAQSVH